MVWKWPKNATQKRQKQKSRITEDAAFYEKTSIKR